MIDLHIQVTFQCGIRNETIYFKKENKKLKALARELRISMAKIKYLDRQQQIDIVEGVLQQALSPMHLDFPSVMEFLTTDFQLSDGKGGMLESVKNKERRGSGVSSELSFGEGLIPAANLELLAEVYGDNSPEQEEIGDDDINEMKMDFEAKYDNENDTEENLMAELRRNREQKAINPYDEPMRQLTPEKLYKPNEDVITMSPDNPYKMLFADAGEHELKEVHILDEDGDEPKDSNPMLSKFKEELKAKPAQIKEKSAQIGRAIIENPLVSGFIDKMTVRK